MNVVHYAGIAALLSVGLLVTGKVAWMPALLMAMALGGLALHDRGWLHLPWIRSRPAVGAVNQSSGPSTSGSTRVSQTASRNPPATVSQATSEAPVPPPGSDLPGRIFYRSHGSGFDYCFDLVELSGDAERADWRAYILTSRDYGTRSQRLIDTHRLSDHRGHYICWDQRVPTKEAMKTICALWSEATERYVSTNRSFDALAAEVQQQFVGRDLWRDV